MKPGSDDTTGTVTPTDFSPSSDRDFLFVPTKHLVLTIQAAYINRGTPIIPDQITTLRDFYRRYHENSGSRITLISDGQSLHLLSETLEAIKQDIPFFFSRHNPAPTTLKDLLALRDILYQRRIPFFEDEQIKNSEKCRQINQALEAYESALNQRELIDATGLVDWTIGTIKDGDQGIFGNVIFRGFYRPLPREKELFRVIREHAETCRYEYPAGGDGNIYDVPEWFGDKISPMEEHPLARLFTGEEIQTQEGLRVGIFQTQHEELEAIAEEISLIHEKGVAFEDITMAAPDLSSHALITGVLNDFGITCQICTGEALNREPLIGFFTLFPSLVVDNFPREDLLILMSSPFFRWDQPDCKPVTISTIDRVLRHAQIVDGPSWDRHLAALVEDLEPGERIERSKSVNLADLEVVRAWINRFQTDMLGIRGEQTLQEHVTALYSILKHWVRPEFLGEHSGVWRVTERERWAWERFNTCLVRLAAMSDPNTKIGPGTFSRYLNYLLEELVTLDETHEGVRVMRLQETAHLEIPHLFLFELVEGDIPRPSTRLPLLSATESELLGSRHLQEVIREEQYYFISALSAGDTVYLSAPRTRSEKILLTSPFLEEVKSRLHPGEWNPVITRSKSHAAITAGRLITKGTESSAEDILNLLPADQKYGSVAERILIEDWYRTGEADSPYDGILSDDGNVTSWLEEKFGPDRVWAPTRLETYATCPFRFFLQRVLYLAPLPEVDQALTPVERGTFIHDALCDFFSQWSINGPRPITTRSLSEASGLLKENAMQNSRRYPFSSPAWYAALRSLLGEEDSCGLFDRFLIHEAAREDSSLLPCHFELEIGGGDRSFVILDQGDGEPVRISGRIDRVDISRDGHFAIIDYKTGGSYPNATGIKEGTALQLPLYLLALEKLHEDDDLPLTGIAGSYCEISRKIKQTWPLLNPDQKNLVGAGTAKATSGFREVILHSLDAARSSITKIRHGRFPLPETCQIPYCEFSGICRFDRFRMNNSREEEA